MDYDDAYKQFATNYNTMLRRLNDWAVSKGGGFDDNGDMLNLEKNNQIHYDIRHAELVALLDYVEAVELRDKKRIADFQQLKTENRLLQTAERERQLNNETVLEKAVHYLSWRISEKDTLDGFRKVLKETVWYIELALKRQLIERDEAVLLKIRKAKEFLLDDTEAKKHFFKQQRVLKQQAEQRLSNFQQNGVNLNAVVKTA